MFIKESDNLQGNVIWLDEIKANYLLMFFPEISRRINNNGTIEIAFMDNTKVREKIKELGM